MAFYDKFPYTNFQELNLDKLISRVEEIGEKTETIYQSVTEATEAAETAQTSAAAAEQSALEAAISAASISALVNKKVLVITDSYADANRGGYANGWYTQFCRYAGLVDGSSAFLYQRGGAGWVVATLGKTFSDLVDDSIIDFTADQRAEFTDVIVAGGANDKLEPYTNINSAVSALNVKIRQNYPNAVVRNAMISGFKTPTEREALMRNVYYVTTFQNIEYSWLRPIVNAYMPMLFIQHYNTTDTVHPNAEGCSAIGSLVASAFVQNSTIGNMVYNGGVRGSVAFNLADGISGSTIFGQIYNLINTLTFRIFSPFSLSGTFDVAFSGGINKLIATSNNQGLVPNCVNSGSAPTFCTVPVEVTFLSSTGAFTQQCELRFVLDTENVVNMYLYAANAQQGMTATQIRVKPVQVMTTFW